MSNPELTLSQNPQTWKPLPELSAPPFSFCLTSISSNSLAFLSPFVLSFFHAFAPPRLCVPALFFSMLFQDAAHAQILLLEFCSSNSAGFHQHSQQFPGCFSCTDFWYLWSNCCASISPSVFSKAVFIYKLIAFHFLSSSRLCSSFPYHFLSTVREAFYHCNDIETVTAVCLSIVKMILSSAAVLSPWKWYWPHSQSRFRDPDVSVSDSVSDTILTPVSPPVSWTWRKNWRLYQCHEHRTENRNHFSVVHQLFVVILTLLLPLFILSVILLGRWYCCSRFSHCQCFCFGADICVGTDVVNRDIIVLTC